MKKNDTLAMKLFCKSLTINFLLLFSLSASACVFDSIVVVRPTCSYTNDGTITIFASGAPNITYSIDNGATFQASNTFTGLSSGMYFIVISSPQPCTASDTINLLPNSNVQANYSVSNTSLSINEIVSFTNTSFAETNSLLDYGDGTDTTNVNVVAYTYGAAGTYTTFLIASDANCSDTAFITITVSGQSALLPIPNVFSPNGDDVNDLWMPQATGMETMEVTIVNRWGEIVKSWTGDKGYWDGYTFPAGVACNEGTYFYWLKAKGYDGVEYNEKGTITLLK